jgi:hypothetical protein
LTCNNRFCLSLPIKMCVMGTTNRHEFLPFLHVRFLKIWETLRIWKLLQNLCMISFECISIWVIFASFESLQEIHQSYIFPRLIWRKEVWRFQNAYLISWNDSYSHILFLKSLIFGVTKICVIAMSCIYYCNMCGITFLSNPCKKLINCICICCHWGERVVEFALKNQQEVWWWWWWWRWSPDATAQC